MGLYESRYIVDGQKSITVTYSDLKGKKIIFANDPESLIIPIAMRKRILKLVFYLLNPKNKYKGLELSKAVTPPSKAMSQGYEYMVIDKGDLFHCHIHYRKGSAQLAPERKPKAIEYSADLSYEIRKLMLLYGELEGAKLNTTKNRIKKCIQKTVARVDDLFKKYMKYFEGYDLGLLFHTYEYEATRPTVNGKSMKSWYPGRHISFPLNDSNEKISPKFNYKTKEEVDIQTQTYIPLPKGAQVNFFFIKKKDGTLSMHFRFGNF